MTLLEQFFQKETEGILSTITNPPLIGIDCLTLILYLEIIRED